MSETIAIQESAQAEEAPREASALALSADDFSALEERVLRAVNLVRHERHARSEAEARAAQAETQLAERGQHVERLEDDLKQLRSERDQIRHRVEKLLKQLDALEL